ncbi:MAG TPA: DsbA family protein [Micromonospora sp.]
MARDKRPRWYFSLHSPYSWFAWRDLTERYPDVLERIGWIPYWEPDGRSRELLASAGVDLPLIAMSRAKAVYVRQDALRVAHSRGWKMTWPEPATGPWERAHLGYLVAAAEGAGPAFVAAAYRARWEDGRDITDRATIADIATGVGLDGERVASAADDAAIRQEGVGCLARAERDSVFGVPFFVHNHDRYWGAERVAAFAEAVREHVVPPAAAEAG